ncbi:MAG: helix-turn-helix domain-containing protein [Planctomycetota bacterium]|jgi:DNA-binding transcriptional regulator YiaG
MTPGEIIQIRKKLKLTQEKFATLIGVSPQTLSRWERGLFKPHPTFEKRINMLSKRVS